ncbi:MAG: ribosome assembly cofactor RimP [Bacteroidales bacterium]|nr:ribosome assembly cofactor RimP [Bacteroidales bacterium]
MIDKQLLTKTIEDAIDGTPLFIVDVDITKDNDITVTVDSPTGVDIDTCMSLTRHIEEVFDRDAEDYSLEVGSAGITAPFRVPQQYRMNIGNPVEVLTADGRKLHATLKAVADDFSTITVTTDTKVKHPGQKRPVIEAVDETLPVENIKRIERQIKI